MLDLYRISCIEHLDRILLEHSPTNSAFPPLIFLCLFISASIFSFFPFFYNSVFLLSFFLSFLLFLTRSWQWPEANKSLFAGLTLRGRDVAYSLQTKNICQKKKNKKELYLSFLNSNLQDIQAWIFQFSLNHH